MTILKQYIGQKVINDDIKILGKYAMEMGYYVVLWFFCVIKLWLCSPLCTLLTSDSIGALYDSIVHLFISQLFITCHLGIVTCF